MKCYMYHSILVERWWMGMYHWSGITRCLPLFSFSALGSYKDRVLITPLSLFACTWCIWTLLWCLVAVSGIGSCSILKYSWAIDAFRYVKLLQQVIYQSCLDNRPFVTIQLETRNNAYQRPRCITITDDNRPLFATWLLAERESLFRKRISEYGYWHV